MKHNHLCIIQAYLPSLYSGQVLFNLISIDHGTCMQDLIYKIYFSEEFDLCDENGKLKQIYNLEPSVNGWESGHFISRATYIVVLFERE